MKISRFLRRQEVEAVTGYSKASIYRLIDQDDFPKPIKLSARCVRWLETDVAAWESRKLELVCAA